MPAGKKVAWYAGEHKDALFYLIIAIVFVEMAVGGVAFFYGIMHAAPEVPGGPPMARFPWLAWIIAAILGPVALLLIVHLAASWLSRTMEEASHEAEASGAAMPELSPGMRRFYAAVRHAPTVVVLTALLLLGCALFFIDGALTMLANLGSVLVPYIPWIAGSVAGLLAICFLAHAILVYRQRKMESEYAWRREVLEKTGLVLLDKNHAALPQNASRDIAAVSGNPAIEILDITPKSIGPAPKDAENSESQ